jgi:hypothetical protein
LLGYKPIILPALRKDALSTYVDSGTTTTMFIIVTFFRQKVIPAFIFQKANKHSSSYRFLALMAEQSTYLSLSKMLITAFKRLSIFIPGNDGD